jgi:hypothetical protein
MNLLIMDVLERLRTLERERNWIFKTVCSTCKHEYIAECSEMDGADWRICLDCGLTEEGWGCGYEILIAESERVGTIDRDKLLQLRTVSLWQRDHGRPLDHRIKKWLKLQ